MYVMRKLKVWRSRKGETIEKSQRKLRRVWCNGAWKADTFKTEGITPCDTIIKES